jgi:hypothetical protein
MVTWFVSLVDHGDYSSSLSIQHSAKVLVGCGHGESDSYRRLKY